MLPVGILLAAGRGRRFDPTGARNKLLQPLSGGVPVVVASALTLLAVLDRVVAVVAPGDGGVADALRAAGCEVSVCLQADSGMAASLVHAISSSLSNPHPVVPAQAGIHSTLAQHGFPPARERRSTVRQEAVTPQISWLIALGDMPHVQAATVRALCAALADGAGIAVPVHQGRRGNPVAFDGRHLPALLALEGDQGARALLKVNPVVEVAVADPSIFQDIDLASDL